MLRKKVAIYVPSTMHDTPAPENVVNYYVNDTLKKLSALYGGATMTPGRGAYVSYNGALITENVYICFAYTNRYKRADLVAICENLKTVFNQECISLETPRGLSFV